MILYISVGDSKFLFNKNKTSFDSIKKKKHICQEKVIKNHITTIKYHFNMLHKLCEEIIKYANNIYVQQIINWI